MCGIAGIHFRKPGSINGPALERFVDNLLLGIESRGGDATGFVSVAPGAERIVAHKEAKTASDFIKTRPSLGDGPIRTVLLHTRFATQGHQNQNENNHPVVHGTTFVTHNGHIGNDTELFRDAEIQRIGEVDSEVIAALINKEGFPKVNVALQKLQGGFAIAAVDPIDYPDQLILAKGNSSPLIFFENDNFIVWASTLDAIKDAWGDSFGTPPRDRKFRQFAPGDILMFNGAEREQHQFKVLEYTRTTYYSSGSRSWSGSYTSLTQAERDEKCLCEHTRWKHGGMEYLGSCYNREGSQGCPCEDFLSASALNDDAQIKCDGCQVFSSYRDMIAFGTDYMLCDECSSEYGFAFEDEEETVVTPVTDLTVYKANELPAPGTKEQRRKWLPLAEGDELLRHNYVLAKASEKAGVNVQFMEWILFRSEIDLVDQDAFLQDAHEACDEAYATAEEELNEWEKEVTQETYAAMVLH